MTTETIANIGLILIVIGFVVMPVIWIVYLDYKAKRGE